MTPEEKEGMKSVKGEMCQACGTFVEGFKYQRCCSAFDCGCRGLPVEPCVCSEECWLRYCDGGE